MAGIRGRDTRPEITLRRGLHALGFRYVLHDRRLPGRPDIVLPRWRAAIMANGCFWHGHDCELFRWPVTRRDFWQVKITRNQSRDADVAARIGEAGWRLLVVWECALKGPGRLGADATVRAAAEWLRAGGQTGNIRGAADASG